MTPRFSAVIDNHNYGRYLGQAIASVLSQDVDGGVECVVVDDGSTDESRQVIASFGSRIVAILQENRGQATAFNRGLAAARGEFVCMLDSDDYWTRDKLKTILPAFSDPEVGLVQHYLQDVDVSGAPLPRRFPAWPPVYKMEDFLDRRIDFTATSGLAFRRSVLQRILPIAEDVFYYLDDLLFARALASSNAANVPKVLGFHRIHDQNYCAGGITNPRKLELDLKMRGIFNREIDPLLEQRGLKYTRRHQLEEDLDYTRRRILLHMFHGERAAATGEWFGILRRHGLRRRGLFRAATCLLALVSADLYARAFEAYNRRPA